MRAIYKRELGSYFHGILGYIFIAVVIVFTGIYTMVYAFNNAYTNFEYVCYSMTFFFLFLVPMITMRSVAEEKRQRTDQLLYSLPMNMSTIVTGKFLAMCTVLLIPVLEMCLIPPIMGLYGNVNFAVGYSAILAYFLLGVALMSIGMFISSLTDNQIVAMILSFAAVMAIYLMASLAELISTSAFASYLSFVVVILLAGVFLYLMIKNVIVTGLVFMAGEILLFVAYQLNSTAFESLIQNVLNQMCLFDRIANFINGIFDWTTVVYYITVTGLFLFLTVQSMEKRRWS